MPEDVATEHTSRFNFPYPTKTMGELRNDILNLMLDGKRRSVGEIRKALNTEKEISARLRELRNGTHGPKMPLNDARADGPDHDGVHRYQLDLSRLPEGVATRRKV